MNRRTVLIAAIVIAVLTARGDAGPFRRRSSRAFGPTRADTPQLGQTMHRTMTAPATVLESRQTSQSAAPTNTADLPSYEQFLRYYPHDPKARRTFEAIVKLATAAPRDESYAEFADVADIDGARYIEETGELILWGPRIDPQRTGYVPPLLHLDDFVAALRVLEEGRDLGVSIGTITGRIPTPDDLETAIRDRRLPVEYIPTSSAGTHAASVLFEADRWLKVLSHGRDNLMNAAVECVVPGHRTMAELLHSAAPAGDGKPHPIGLHWIESEPTGVAFEGYTIKFVDYKMQCKYKAVVDDPVVQEAVRKFGEQMSHNFGEYAREYVVFRELIRLHKLVQVARWYKENGFPYERLLREYKPLRIATPQTTAMMQTEVRRTNRYQYFMFGGVDFSAPNYYLPAASVPQAVLVPGAPPQWGAADQAMSAAPPRYGSFAGKAPVPQFVTSLVDARPAPTSSTWVVNVQGNELRVVAIPVHEDLPATIPAGTYTVVASGLVSSENGEHYSATTRSKLVNAYSLSKDYSQVKDFAQSMRQVATSLPTLRFNESNGSAPWVKLRLNSFGTHMDGVVFSSPLVTQADLCAVIVVPEDVKWHFCVLPFHALGHAFRRDFFGRGLRVAGVDLPENNQADFLSMGTSSIEPGQQCTMFFSFEQDDPVDVWLSMRWFPAQTISPPMSREDVARVVGVPWPAPFESSGAFAPPRRLPHGLMPVPPAPPAPPAERPTFLPAPPRPPQAAWRPAASLAPHTTIQPELLSTRSLLKLIDLTATSK